ncbi:MAG: hypothetical protein JO149_04915 [Gammaproteobacteria bacterium]|nr:hypothetical protein [Gammaproteobacteria bacterium]
MQARKFSLEETLEYAIKAMEYAQLQIKKGATQVSNNELAPDYFSALNKGVTQGTRILIKKDYKAKIKNDVFNKQKALAYFESVIKFSSKYSLGNCNELALHALNYVLNDKTTTMQAEVYIIQDGDHVFLVLNRDADSKEDNPMTWGNAVICDPWSNKIYPAKDYLTELADFKRINGKNTALPINEKTRLKQKEDVNTQFLKPLMTIENLKNIFLTETELLLSYVKSYDKSLKLEEIRLKEKYGDQHGKVLILAEKRQLIKASLKTMEQNIQALVKKEFKNDYHFAKAQLRKAWKLINQNIEMTVQFSPEHQARLFEYEGTELQKKYMTFFDKKTDTQWNIEIITEEFNKNFLRKSK